MIPAQRPGFLGADTGHQAQDHVGTEPGTPGGFEDGGGLLCGQRLAWPAGLACRGVDQRGHVVGDMAVGLGVAQGPGQRVVRERHCPAGIARRHMDQGPADIVRGQQAQLDAADDCGDQLEDVMVEPDRPGRPAVQPLGEPVVGSPLDRVGMLGLHAGVLLGLELLELFGDLGPGAAGDLVPPPCLPVRAVANRDPAVPAALGLVLVNRPFVAPATPGASSTTTHEYKDN